MSVVLVTGAATGLGARIAQQLAGRGARVLGLGDAATYVPANVTLLPTPSSADALTAVLRAEGVDALVHTAMLGEEERAPGGDAAMQRNVLGTTELAGVCVRAGVRRLVLRSSTLVYGLRYDQPAFIEEHQPVQRPQRAGLLRDYCDIELFAADFARWRPDLGVVVLRCAGLVGGDVASPLTRYLAQSQPQTLFGFDPRIQMLHPDDAAAAFALACASEAAGAFNLAAVDPITLVHTIRLAGRRPAPLPGPLIDLLALLNPRTPLAALPPLDPLFLRYPCVADTRRARTLLGWQPAHSTEDALQEQQTEDERRKTNP